MTIKYSALTEDTTPTIKYSALTEDTTPTTDDNISVLNDPSGTPDNKRASIKNIFKSWRTLTALAFGGFADTDRIPIIDETTPEPKYFTIADIRKYSKHEISLIIPASDEGSDLSTGTSKITFRMPFAMTLTDIRASVNTAPTGSILIADVNDGGTSIMTTDKLDIDAGEKTTESAVNPPVLTDTTLADDAEITVDIDQVGSTTTGKGLKVTLIGYRT